MVTVNSFPCVLTCPLPSQRKVGLAHVFEQSAAGAGGLWALPGRSDCYAVGALALRPDTTVECQAQSKHQHCVCKSFCGWGCLFSGESYRN